jgi:pimeloyl-ACP methyl ester carboxylesterase
MHVAYGAVLATALLGWAEITIQPSRGDRVQTTWQRTVGEMDRPEERTVETLRRYDLEKRYRHDVDGVLAALHQSATVTPDADVVYALAELSWIEGRRLDRRHRAQALDRYVDAVAYAYDFLFDPELKDGRHPSDPRFRTACDLYNGGLDRLIRAVKSKTPIEPGGRTIVLRIHGREHKLIIDLTNSPWTPEDVDELLLASDFEVSGLPTRTYQYGIGVPLIGVRKSDHPGQGDDKFYTAEMAFPLTAFLRPISPLRKPDAAEGEARPCTLQLIDPVRWPFGQPPTHMPVESDLTTPLAYMWSRTDLSRIRWTGLLRPGEVADRTGLMLLRPYERDKIPVVMVHGLASSPLAWIPMINDLLRDPNIQKNYQFFLYLYPTGVPIPIAAAWLREAITSADRTFNPDGPNPYFMQMVLLGHSMGGLLSHAMTVDSNNRFWEVNTDTPFNQIVGPPEILEKLRRYMFFKPLPYVRRVVFLATPHRGSELSRGVVGRVSSGLISEPDEINGLLYRLVRDNPDAFDRRQFRRLPTSIDTLEPDSPYLLALLAMSPGPNVIYHSIIGAIRPGPPANSTDGVVAYRSSHLDGAVSAVSERLVRSDHGVQKDPAAILEVRRILIEHWNALSREPGAAPVRREAAALPRPEGATVQTQATPPAELPDRPD